MFSKSSHKKKWETRTHELRVSYMSYPESNMKVKRNNEENNGMK